MPDASDIRHMRHALRLAQARLGHVWPNPSVGAVVVKEGNGIASGATAQGGRPHAETIALEAAGKDAKGATLYVTLEPCAHQGKTPPCTGAIIKAGITRVVAACSDPHPQVAGKGFEQLKAAGIEVTTGVCEAEALALNEGFFSVVKRRRPFVTLKLATSLDGKIADKGGKSHWITGEEARARGHMLRATHDAILTGIGTLLADDPMLTCRLPGREEDSPERIILDGSLRVSETAKALPAWIFSAEETLKEQKKKAAALEAKGSKLFPVSVEGGHLSLYKVLSTLAEQGITRLLVEAGSALSTAFVNEGLVDRLYWFRAPMVIGEEGLSALKGGDLPLKDLPVYALQSVEKLGGDALEIYDFPTP